MSASSPFVGPFAGPFVTTPSPFATAAGPFSGATGRRLPGAADYLLAMQHPDLHLSDPELANAEVAVDALGLPRAISGNFATVFRLTDGRGRSYMVRCFVRSPDDLSSRYAALERHLRQIDAPWLVPFEFQERGIRVGRDWYPIVRSPWLEGRSLSAWIGEHLWDSDAIAGLAVRFGAVVESLRRHGIAHGDLQHGNVLIGADGELRLIDYDGMYVPGLDGMPSGERGHRNYQHPRRGSGDWGPHLDHFATWVIYTSLLSLSVDPLLWGRLDGGDDCLLFRWRDFADPTRSTAFACLESRPDTTLAELASALRDFVSLPVHKLPALPDLTDLLPTPIGRTSTPSIPAGGPCLPACLPAGAGPGLPAGAGPGLPVGAGQGLPAGAGPGLPAGAGPGLPAGAGVATLSAEGERRAGRSALVEPAAYHPRSVVTQAGPGRPAVGAMPSGGARGGSGPATGPVRAPTGEPSTPGVRRDAPAWPAGAPTGGYAVPPVAAGSANGNGRMPAPAVGAGTDADLAAARGRVAELSRRRSHAESNAGQLPALREEQRRVMAQETAEISDVERALSAGLAEITASGRELHRAEQAALAAALVSERDDHVRTRLASHPISALRPAGVTEAMQASLAWSGVRTAADFIDVVAGEAAGSTVVLTDGRKLRLDSLAPAQGRAMVDWRRRLERRFVASCTHLSEEREAAIVARFEPERRALAEAANRLRIDAARQTDQIRRRHAARRQELADLVVAEQRQLATALVELDKDLDDARRALTEVEWRHRGRHS